MGTHLSQGLNRPVDRFHHKKRKDEIHSVQQLTLLVLQVVQHIMYSIQI
jgi:hypothetical protein